MSRSISEENYLKAIYAICSEEGKGASTNAIAKRLDTRASSVTDMIRKLSEKGYVNYRKYKGTELTKNGEEIALNIIRKHRLWEVFLVDKLHFGWEEVHEVAEQLEHIRSPKLIQRLDTFLEHPQYDPHGDPIPDENGVIKERKSVLLSELENGQQGLIIGVTDTSPEFLQFLKDRGLTIGTEVTLKNRYDFDGSVEIDISGNGSMMLSDMVNRNISISLTNE